MFTVPSNTVDINKLISAAISNQLTTPKTQTQTQFIAKNTTAKADKPIEPKK